MTEGPYYVDDMKVRRDITEGLPGAPLSLRLSVLDASTCKPIKGAAVDIWHASAGGKYSGAESNDTVGRTYLRGIQRTDAKGLARFATVYPGWYPGRAVHIHVKVHVGGDEVHTGQLFFRDSISDAVYKRAPYKARGARDDAQRGRLDLRRRRQPLAAGDAQRRQGLRRVDQHGRQPQLTARLRRARASRRRAGCRRGCTPPRVRAGG